MWNAQAGFMNSKRFWRGELWKALSEYNNKIIQIVKSFYIDNKVCININGEYTTWFNISKSARH